MSDSVKSDMPALLFFVLIAFGWSRAPWLISAMSAPLTQGLSPALFIIAGFRPSLAGLITVWIFQDQSGLRHWLARCMAWRMNPGWYALAFFGPALGIMAAIGMKIAVGGSLPPRSTAGHLGTALLQGALILFIGGPLGEEFGWRCYALSGLTLRLGWRWDSLGTSDQRLRLRRTDRLTATRPARSWSSDRFRGFRAAFSAACPFSGRLVLMLSASVAPGTGCRARTG